MSSRVMASVGHRVDNTRMTNRIPWTGQGGAVMVAIMLNSGCNSILGTEDIRTNGCPSVGVRDCIDASTPQTCAANGKWEPLAPCYEQACQAGKCVGICSPGTWRCNDKQPQFCDDTGQWQNDALACEHVCFEGTCLGSCTPGETRCNGDTPQTCNGNGSWKSADAPCADQWCNPDTGTCEGSCLPGQSFCTPNNEYKHCNARGQVELDPPCDHQTCDNNLGCIGVCAPYETSCIGNRISLCVDGKFKTNTPCFGQTCRNGTCIGECEPGKRCSGETVQTCDIFGQWQNVEVCSGNVHCEGGACVTNCVTGDKECQGNTSYACIDGTWTKADVCVDQTCIPTTGDCEGECAPGQARCVGQTPETCEPTGHWKALPACAGVCVEGTCPGPSCNGLAENCGPNQNENCCAGRVVPSLTFYHNGDPKTPAMISEFRLDRFEVTVGRFKKFVAAFNAGSVVLVDGVGAHPKIPGSGWQSSWNADLMNQVGPGVINPEWSDTRPISERPWITAFAFCAWDGGRIPTYTEWEGATKAGPEYRRFPWSAPPSSLLIDPSYAVYACTGDGSPPNDDGSHPEYCDNALDLLPVGSRSPKGDGKYGHADLIGNLTEWSFDAFDLGYPVPCNDCAPVSTDPGATSLFIGAYYRSQLAGLGTAYISSRVLPWEYGGFRCARQP